MRVELETRLEASPDWVAREVRTPRLLAHVSAPLLTFRAVDPPELPEQWAPGRYRVRMLAFGWIPLGGQWIGVELPDGLEPTGGPWRLRDNGSGDWIARWDHCIRIEALPDGTTRYGDRVDIEAGLLTPFVWLLAQLFYRHRQRRWRRHARAEARARARA